MDIETKEAVLKLAGYELEGVRDLAGRSFGWRVYNRETSDNLAYALTKPAAISLAYNTFLTRQNDVS